MCHFSSPVFIELINASKRRGVIVWILFQSFKKQMQQTLFVKHEILFSSPILVYKIVTNTFKQNKDNEGKKSVVKVL